MLLSEDEQVSQAYKNGPLGSVPIDWEKTPFSELFVSFIEYTNDLDRFPLYSLTIEDGVTAKTERYERSHLVKKKNLYKVVRPNDFVYNPMNVRFGAIARYKGSSPVAVSGYYDVFSSVHESDSVFMENFLTFAPIISYYNKVSTGSLIEKQRVHFSKFLKFAFPLPSLQERKKIAAILSTQDKVIELKEKLLAQKQQQKKYLMQQLLTGKKRLPGFGGEWKTIHLNEISCRNETKNTVGNNNVLTISAQYGLINQTEFFDKVIASDDKSNYYLLSKDEFAYNRSYSKGYPYGTIKRLKRYVQGVVSPLYICFAVNKKLASLDFLEQYFETSIINREIQSIVQEGARNHGMLNVAVDDFFRIKITMPETEEQKEIAKILRVADHEIDLLQKSIEAEKQKKKALMQLLLTGKVRVKI